MFGPRLLIHFLHRESLLTIFMWLMGLGIVMLLDSLVTIWVAAQLGAYVAVALVGILSWINLAIIFTAISRHIGIIRKLAARGAFSALEFMQLSGLLLSALLIILPGFLTDLMAWIVFLPPIRIGIGAIIFHRFKPQFEELQQHLSTEEP